MRREFLKQFLNKISTFPKWLKKIIYNQISKEINIDDNLAYVFATYKPVLTYKGRCENDFHKSGFDSNIYNILEAVNNNLSISDIILNTYLSMEEIARYFLFCIDEEYFELPDDSQILYIAEFLAGKLRTGEYFVKNGTISQNQLNNAIETNKKENKNFGQALVQLGFITQNQLDTILSIKNEAQKRFILDCNDVPKIKQEYSDKNFQYEQQIADLKLENKKLKIKLEQLLTMVKNYDE